MTTRAPPGPGTWGIPAAAVAAAAAALGPSPAWWIIRVRFDSGKASGG